MAQSRATSPLNATHGAFDEVSVSLSGPLAHGYALAHPVMVEIFVENGKYVASVDELHIHAFGASAEQALMNLRQRIVEQFLNLEGDRLGPEMRKVALRLATLVIAEHA